MKPSYRNKLIWLATILTFHGSAVACQPSAVFSFTKALYTGQTSQAQQLLAKVRDDRGEQMALFLNQVLRWKQGFDQHDHFLQSDALSVIGQQLKALKKSYLHNKDIKTALMVGNISIHAARMNLVMGKLYTAAKLAKLSHEMISKVFKDEPNNVDALLASGLYQIYAGQRNQSDFIKKWFVFDGDKIRGRTLIEKALQASPDYSYEAARTLLTELGGSRQQACNYPNLINADSEGYSFTAYQLFINQMLYCGRAQQSIQAIDLAILQANQKTQKEWLFAAKLHALAQLGAVDEIKLIREKLLETKIQQLSKVQFALAKSLDVNHQSINAKALYTQVLNSNLDKNYKRLAASYIKTPYTPSIFNVAQNMQFACEQE